MNRIPDRCWPRRPREALRLAWLLSGVLALSGFVEALADEPQPPGTWVKRSPIEGSPPSPGLGYEAALVYDPGAKRVIRWGGHNPGGGGEQNGETWTLDPTTMRWELKEPNTSPPGACCAQQNVFDVGAGRTLRFPAFSGNHGWQWFREIDLNDASVWSYDLPGNTWRKLLPLPAPRVGPLRCASWDDEHQVVVLFGGEGSREGTVVYDPYTNAWSRMRPRVEPEFRSGGNLAYDTARGVHVLFGSQFIDDPHTWTYLLHRNEWRDMIPRVQPPTDRNDAVLAYDTASRRVVALVRAFDRRVGNEPDRGRLETWAYDAGENTWTRRSPSLEPDGWNNRRRLAVAIPDQGLVLVENFVSASDRIPGVGCEQQVWTYRDTPAPIETAPRAPADVRVRTTHDTAIVEWQSSGSGEEVAWIVERAEGETPWLAEFRPVGQAARGQGSYEDHGLAPGVIYHYKVRAVGRDGKAGPASRRVRTQPRIVESAVVSVESPHRLTLSWHALDSPDIVGYHVERAVADVFSEDQIRRQKSQLPPLPTPSIAGLRAVGPFERLTRQPMVATSFVDTTIDLARVVPLGGFAPMVRRFRPDQLDPSGKPYRFAVHAYRIRAVNALGVQGGDSPLFTTIPSGPQWLFSREDGTACRLKWAANPEAGLKGYRVYRMDGPRTNGPGQRVVRLTPDPIAVSHYTDDQAGHETRRYWVVAVDALGQEGFPSAPVWHEREYRKVYAPFVGPWHQ